MINYKHTIKLFYFVDKNRNATKIFQCLTIGDDWIAVGAKSCRIFLFSLAGVQILTFLLPSEPITMAAYREKLSIAYNDGIG